MRRFTKYAMLAAGLAACGDPTRPVETAPTATPAAADVAAAARRFNARNLGTLGGEASFGNGINESSVVVGSAELPTGEFRAFRWEAGKGMQNLGTLGGSNSSADEINDLGEVVGLSEIRPGSDVVRAFVWSEARGMRGGLGTLGGVNSVAQGINNRGEVVGVSENANRKNRAFLWRRGRAMRSLGTLGGASSEATDINDATQVVGFSETATGEEHAFLWTAAQGMEDLGTLGGGGFSVALGISQTGDVVGVSETSPGSGEAGAFLWTRGRGMRSLGNLGGFFSIAFGVNTHRQVAAGADTPTLTTFPAIWTPKNGMQRLPTIGGLMGGDFVGQATRINEFGRMTGYSFNAQGVVHATLWTPAGPGPLLAIASDEAPQATTAAPAEVSPAVRATLCAVITRGTSKWSHFRTTLSKACVAR